MKDVLSAKGFETIFEGDGTDLLIPIPYSPLTNHNILFAAFNEQRSRKEILMRINDSTFVVTHPDALNLINHPDFISDRNRYSTCFEWYAGELMVRRFSSFSASYGVKVKDSIGDYDAIAVLRDINTIYFECKTGSFDRNKIFMDQESGKLF